MALCSASGAHAQFTNNGGGDGGEIGGDDGFGGTSVGALNEDQSSTADIGAGSTSEQTEFVSHSASPSDTSDGAVYEEPDDTFLDQRFPGSVGR
ncbi:MAG: hypothetical protein AAFV45_13485 [Pseudomonadota bacterium]